MSRKQAVSLSEDGIPPNIGTILASVSRIREDLSVIEKAYAEVDHEAYSGSDRTEVKVTVLDADPTAMVAIDGSKVAARSRLRMAAGAIATMLLSADQARRVLEDRRSEAKPIGWAKSESIYRWTDRAAERIEREYQGKVRHV